MHGGDVQLTGVDADAGVVRLAVSGKCVDCPWVELTYQTMLGDILKKEVAGIREIIVEV
ncbi:MAG: NifU family protein [Minisyncoccia bacterium]|jgi:Fe-S cluster biogenesis protein NfuA